jgi:hypothetical protein
MTGTRRIAAAAACVLTAVLAAAGCSSSGGSTSETTHNNTPIFDPCTQISDDILRQAGLDPSSKDKDVAGVHYKGWDLCGWKPVNFDIWGVTSYGVTVYSTNGESLEQVRNDSFNNHFADVTVAGHNALQFHSGGTDPALDCDVAFATSVNGVIDVSIDRNEAGSYNEPVCATTNRMATLLLPSFASVLQR